MIRQHAQRLALDPRITLFDVDLTSLGGGVQRFVPMENLLGNGSEFEVSHANVSAARYVSELLLDPTELSEATHVFFRLVYRRGKSFQINLVVGDLGSGNISGNRHIFRPTTDNFTTVNPEVSGTGAGATTSSLEHFALDSNFAVMLVSVELGTFSPDSLRFDLGSSTPNNDPLSLVEMGAHYQTADGSIHSCLGSNNSPEDFSLLVDPVVEGTISEVVSEQLTSPIMWRGNAYTPLPVEATGFSVSSTGTLPRPTLTLANYSGVGTTLATNHGDLLGAPVTRWRTFRRYLDDGLTPDPNAHFPTDQYLVDRKASHGKAAITWELASVLDQQGTQLPGRQILRTGCQLLYRRWDADAGAFDYTNATCPYVGAALFDLNDTALPPTPAQSPNDRCSQTLIGCQRRFSGEIPFGGFPSVGKIRR